MSAFGQPPSLSRLKPLACSILLAFSAPYVCADTSIKMGSNPIELPGGVEEKAEHELQAIEVNGEFETKDERGQNNVFAKDVSNVYVGKTELERYKGTSVADVFQGLNGVYSGDSRNSGALDPNIRGIQGEGRIPVTVDGTEQATAVWMGSAGVANRNYIDPNMIGSISVEKGPSLNPDIKSGVGGGGGDQDPRPG